MSNVKLLYVGIGGYGVTNLDRFICGELEGCEIAGVVDVKPETTWFYNRLVEMGTKIYHSLDEFYAENTADLAIISTPIQFHAPQSIYCMKHGSNVICEKPVASTVEEALEMKKVSEETGRFIDVGYQASYSLATLNFKADVTDGVFGKPISAKTLCLWPRTEKYYGRSAWAGKLQGPNGEWILDSVANNATAHYLHNMFYVLGGADNCSLTPDKIEFELYRGNPIESFDTCALRAEANGVPVLFLVSHTVDEHLGPVIEFRFEKATVSVGGGEDGDDIVATFTDGTKKNYGSMQLGRAEKLQRAIDMCRWKAVMVCGVDAALPQALVIREFHRDPAFIHDVKSKIEVKEYETEGLLHYYPGMAADLRKCFAEGKLPSEIGCGWAVAPVVTTVKV